MTTPTTATTVGTQTMVNRIRDLGVDNPIVVMGLLPGTGTGGWTLHGMPTLNDPIAGPSQLVLLGTLPTHRRDRPTGATDLGHRVRNTAASLPVMVGAFNVSSKTRCTKQTPTAATDLVTQYLTGKGVGIAGWAFDYPQSSSSRSAPAAA